MTIFLINVCFKPPSGREHNLFHNRGGRCGWRKSVILVLFLFFLTSTRHSQQMENFLLFHSKSTVAFEENCFKTFGFIKWKLVREKKLRVKRKKTVILRENSKVCFSTLWCHLWWTDEKIACKFAGEENQLQWFEFTRKRERILRVFMHILPAKL